jgi:hypothetical protein
MACKAALAFEFGINRQSVYSLSSLISKKGWCHDERTK